MKHAIARTVFYCVVLTTALLSGVASGNGCIDCHSNPDFYVQERLLYTYYQDYISSRPPTKAS